MYLDGLLVVKGVGGEVYCWSVLMKKGNGCRFVVTVELVIRGVC